MLESEWKLLIRKAVATILQHVAGNTKAHKMWHKPSALYERKNALNQASLMRKIVRLKYIVVHINTFMGLVNQLVVAKCPLDDALQALLLLCTLPESWENYVVSLSTSCQEEQFSLQVVKTSILNEETRRKEWVSCPSRRQMWHNIPEVEEVNTEVHKRETDSCQVQVQRKTHMFLLWKTWTLPEGLSTPQEGQRYM